MENGQLKKKKKKSKFKSNLEGHSECRPQARTTVDSTIWKSATATTLMCLHLLPMESLYFYIVHVLLLLLNFTAIYWILWIVKCRLMLRPNAKFVDLPHDSDPFQNLMGSSLAHAAPCHQVSWKTVCRLCARPSQTKKQTRLKNNLLGGGKKPVHSLLVFVILEHTVCVEHGSILHFLDKRTWLRGLTKWKREAIQLFHQDFNLCKSTLGFRFNWKYQQNRSTQQNLFPPPSILLLSNNSRHKCL